MSTGCEVMNCEYFKCDTGGARCTYPGAMCRYRYNQDAEISRLNAERRRDALDGQAALDEANNTIAALTRTLREASDGHKGLREENERLKKSTDITYRRGQSILNQKGIDVIMLVGNMDHTIDALKQENERLANVKRTMFCLYCGKDFYHYAGEFPPSKEEASEAYKACFDHDRACPDNPIVRSLAAAEAREKKLLAIIDDYKKKLIRVEGSDTISEAEKRERELREKVVRFIYLADHFAFQTEPPDPHAEGEGCRDCDYRREIEDAVKEYNIAEYAEQILGGEK